MKSDFGHAEGFHFAGAGKDDVFHFAAAENRNALFAEDPADGIEHIGFAAAVRPDDARNSCGKLDRGLKRERFESEYF